LEKECYIRMAERTSKSVYKAFLTLQNLLSLYNISPNFLMLLMIQ